jgi:hypothetical protein
MHNVAPTCNADQLVYRFRVASPCRRVWCLGAKGTISYLIRVLGSILMLDLSDEEKMCRMDASEA